jgi:hypothetical protein
LIANFIPEKMPMNSSETESKEWPKAVVIAVAVGVSALLGVDIYMYIPSGAPHVEVNVTQHVPELNNPATVAQQAPEKRAPNPPLKFETDPLNQLPIFSIADVDRAMDSDLKNPRNPINRQRIRMIGKIENILGTTVYFDNSPQTFQYNHFEVAGFKSSQVDLLAKGMTVEMVCKYGGEFRTDGPNDRYTSWTYLFSGEEIHEFHGF